MGDMLIAVGAVSGTVCAYLAASWLYRRIYTPFLLPVAIATLLVIISLLALQIPYDTYMSGAQWIDMFLGPAVVALAYPLYMNRGILKELAIPIVCGTFIGAIVGVTSGVVLVDLLGFEETIIYSVTPKSVTTPVAMDISSSLSGVSSLAAVFVMIAGISGAMFSTFAFKFLHLDHVAGRGVGLGSASHAIGTARALENSLMEGSISTIAMIISAVFVSVMAPILISLLLG